MFTFSANVVQREYFQQNFANHEVYTVKLSTFFIFYVGVLHSIQTRCQSLVKSVDRYVRRCLVVC